MNTFLNLLKFIVPLILILVSFVLGFLFEKHGFNRLKKILRITKWKGSKIVLNSLRGVILLWFVITGIFGAVLILPLNPSVFVIIQKALLATFLASATLVLSRLAVGFINFYSSQREDGSTLTSLFNNLTRLVIFSLGILIILQSLGIAITPLLTALGVGGVSIGLAIQNTLSNLFSGLNIITSKKVRPGDYIKLATGEEGYVTDIEWRHTTIQAITDNLIVIPNAKLVSSTFINYALPTKEMLILIDIDVSYGSDLDKVEAVTLEVAKEILNEVVGGVPDYQPFIRYNKFDYFSINFTVYLRIREFFDHLIIRHEFIKKIHKRYQLEGITIPFPIKMAYIPSKNLVQDSRNHLGHRLSHPHD